MAEPTTTTPAATLPPEVRSIGHFVDLARRGAMPGASPSMLVARKLAKALQAAGDDICLLDSSALDGLCGLIRQMAGPWPTAEYKDAVYGLVVRVAGKRT